MARGAFTAPRVGAGWHGRACINMLLFLFSRAHPGSWPGRDARRRGLDELRCSRKAACSRQRSTNLSRRAASLPPAASHQFRSVDLALYRPMIDDHLLLAERLGGGDDDHLGHRVAATSGVKLRVRWGCRRGAVVSCRLRSERGRLALMQRGEQRGRLLFLPRSSSSMERASSWGCPTFGR